MKRTGQDVTDAELAVLQVLWEHGPASVRHLADTLYPGGGVSAYATVQKLLERLEQKGCVTQKREEGVKSYSALVSKEDLIGRRLRAVAEQLCDGSLTPLLTHLVRSNPLSADERKELQALLTELTQNPKGRKS
jgi:BlaI family transcriptional regulator, penicillinase repressor